jgi:transcriptional regulator with XRE-family HTH domain
VNPGPVPSAGGEPAARRGRRLTPIGQDVGIAHRAWLEPVRDRLVVTGLTLEELVSRANYSKSRISELLRGQGHYPRWEFTHSVAQALGLPTWPLRRLWAQAAREADKKTEWITQCVDLGPSVAREQPVDHQGFTDSMRKPYTRFACVFLQSNHRSRVVVSEAFDILWLCWEQALLSDNVPRYAWTLLRQRVLARCTARRPPRSAGRRVRHRRTAPRPGPGRPRGPDR